MNQKNQQFLFQERWWLAPACRGDPLRCVAVVTAGAGWGTDFMIQQAGHFPGRDP